MDLINYIHGKINEDLPNHGAPEQYSQVYKMRKIT